MAREKENIAQSEAHPSCTMSGSPSATWTNSWAACGHEGPGRSIRSEGQLRVLVPEQEMSLPCTTPHNESAPSIVLPPSDARRDNFFERTAKSLCS